VQTWSQKHWSSLEAPQLPLQLPAGMAVQLPLVLSALTAQFWVDVHVLVVVQLLQLTPLVPLGQVPAAPLQTCWPVRFCNSLPTH
jgi:hypothetical protein